MHNILNFLDSLKFGVVRSTHATDARTTSTRACWLSDISTLRNAIQKLNYFFRNGLWIIAYYSGGEIIDTFAISSGTCYPTRTASA